MAFRCSCGYENENGRAFAGHLGRYSNFGHQKIGWVDPQTGGVLDTRPRGAQATLIRHRLVPQMVKATDGLELKIARIRAGLRQYELAAKVGITQTKLSYIESGRVQPGREQLERILEVLANNTGRIKEAGGALQV